MRINVHRRKGRWMKKKENERQARETVVRQAFHESTGGNPESLEMVASGWQQCLSGLGAFVTRQTNRRKLGSLWREDRDCGSMPADRRYTGEPFLCETRVSEAPKDCRKVAAKGEAVQVYSFWLMIRKGSRQFDKTHVRLFFRFRLGSG